jgi:hypothetical protein
MADLRNKKIKDTYSGLYHVARLSDTNELTQGEGTLITRGENPLGSNNVAKGSVASAFGVNNVAFGGNSSAFGNGNLVSGSKASAFGYGNTVAQDSSQALSIGTSNIVTGSNCNAFGSFNTVSGIGGTASVNNAFGSTNRVYQSYSTAVGNNCLASGTATTAVGYQAHSLGDNSLSVGYNTIASGSNNVAVGYRCKSTVEDPSYTQTGSAVFGCGVVNKVSNAVEIGKWDVNEVDRQGAVRMDKEGLVSITLQDSSSEPTDGGSTAGGEAAGRLPRECYAIRRNGNSIILDVNIGGTVKNITLGTAS